MFAGKAVNDDFDTNGDLVINWPIHRWANAIKATDVTSVDDKIFLRTNDGKASNF